MPLEPQLTADIGLTDFRPVVSYLQQAQIRATDRKVKAGMSLVIFGIVLVALVVLAALFGTDSRDGDDWIEHTGSTKRR